MAHKVTLIPGDGIGPEVTQAVVRILEATGVAFEWDRYAAGAEAFEIYGEYIPQALYESIERNKVALKGPVTTPIGGGFKSINVTLRKKFDLFANFRPIKNLPGLETKFPNVDLIIVRENTEGEYVGLEHEVVPGVVESLKVITEKGSTRIARFAPGTSPSPPTNAAHKSLTISPYRFSSSSVSYCHGFITSCMHVLSMMCSPYCTSG